MTIIEAYAFAVLACVVVIMSAEIVAMSGMMKQAQKELNHFREEYIKNISNVAVDVESVSKDMDTLSSKLTALDEKVQLHGDVLDEMKEEYIEYTKAAAKSETDWDEGMKSILDFSVKTMKENS